MKKSLFLLAFSYLFSQSSFAGDGDYNALKIPEALLKNANAVLRLEEIRFEILSTKETREINHYVITILNESGDDWAEFVEGYDKFKEIDNVEGILYDAYGKQLKRIKKKDLQDLSGNSGSNLADDNRIKRHNFYYKIYPYTVEYTSEVTYKGSLFFPSWSPQGHEKLSVEKSTISVVCPADYSFRYKAYNYEKEPVVTQEKNNRVTTWSAQNMPAIVREPYSPLWHELTTYLILGPTDFQMEDYKGNMQTWQDFGKFVYALKKDRDKLPDNIKQTIHQIADGITDQVEKVKKLYEYMQDNTRYVSIQLGIGGWQPFDATYVANKKYGDCKALTNFMYSLLKEAGINSYYTLVRAGKYSNYITDDFPSQQFNHVILCVPIANDTMWLECTSQTMPAGYLGDFTCDRYALLINESGGKLVRTPKYGIKENTQNRTINASLDDNGTMTIKATTRYSGLEQDDVHGMINYLSKDKVKEYLHEQLDFATYDINNFDYKEEKTQLPSIQEKLEITASNYATVTGRRLFIVPNLMTRTSRRLAQDTTRKYDIQLGYEYNDLDTVEINLPQGYEAEALPQDVTIKSEFGKYSCAVKLKDNKLMYYRNIESYGGRFPAKDYSEFVDFWNTVYKTDRNKVVLVKNETEKKAF